MVIVIDQLTKPAVLRKVIKFKGTAVCGKVHVLKVMPVYGCLTESGTQGVPSQ